MSEYDLRKSEEGIGQLYPILEAKDGEIIDGVHRDKADKNWKRVKLEHIDTEEKKLVARLVANFHRRIVPYQEKKDWINGLARIYQERLIEGSSIIQKIVAVTGLSDRTVGEYLEDKYKLKIFKDRKVEPKVPASQRITTELGKEYVERHREEVIQEETPKIEKKLKLKLVKSPQFQREVLEELRKPRIVKPTEPCPSGVCELPSNIDAGKQVDIRLERLAKFWQDNPECRCRICIHYMKCGVIR